MIKEYICAWHGRKGRRCGRGSEERGAEYYSPIISDVDHLSATGDRLITPGIVLGPDPRAFITEVTEGGEIVFEAEVRFRNSLSTGAFAWGQFDLVYRSERIALYPNND